MDFSTVVGIGGAAAASAAGVFGWLAKRSIAQLDQKIRDHDTALQARADDMSAYKLYVAEHYVTQTELTKAVGSLERTIERLIDAVNQNSKETREGFAEIHRRIDTKADK